MASHLSPEDIGLLEEPPHPLASNARSIMVLNMSGFFMIIAERV